MSNNDFVSPFTLHLSPREFPLFCECCLLGLKANKSLFSQQAVSAFNGLGMLPFSDVESKESVSGDLECTVELWVLLTMTSSFHFASFLVSNPVSIFV